MFEGFARIFDLPTDSAEQRAFMEEAWFGGSFVTIPYWLGRLVGRNLFRESKGTWVAALQQYFVDRGEPVSARMAANTYCWDTIARLLEHRGRVALGIPTRAKPRLIVAIETTLEHPEMPLAELARIVNTTEKQIARMSDVTVLRDCWRRMREGRM
jgi:hypothetical protein